jgi:hypothetical protein
MWPLKHDLLAGFVRKPDVKDKTINTAVNLKIAWASSGCCLGIK